MQEQIRAGIPAPVEAVTTVIAAGRRNAIMVGTLLGRVVSSFSSSLGGAPFDGSSPQTSTAPHMHVCTQEAAGWDR